MNFLSRTLWRCSVLPLIFASGCTIAPLKFQVIDAETRRPLEGVLLQQNGIPATVEILPYHRLHISYPLTAANGIVVTERIDTYHYFHGFDFSKSGYLATIAGFEQYKLRFEVFPAAPEKGASYSGDPAIITTKLDEIIVIPMYRIGSPNAPIYKRGPK